MARDTDRNVIVGILALQLNLIGRNQWISAMHTWVLDKTRPLEDILREHRSIEDQTADLLAGLVDRHMSIDISSDSQSDAASSSLQFISNDLKSIRDQDIDDSLTRISQTFLAAIRLNSPMTVETPQPEASRYQVMRLHAEGGLGRVLIARDSELNRQVAVKEIHPKNANEPRSQSRFFREARITGRLEHPGIVPVYSLGQSSTGQPFYAMRFIEGQTLETLVSEFRSSTMQLSKSRYSLQLRRLIRRLVDVCETMAYAHEQGVIHRDLKPSNIMVGKYGETLIVDWGLAKVDDSEASIFSAHAPTEAFSEPEDLTQQGDIVGTYAYMAPEQAGGDVDSMGPATDIYSLGGTLYCLMTGRASISNRLDRKERKRRILESDFPAPGTVEPRVPEPLEAVCLKAMSNKVNDRYQTARELANDLELWLADEPPSVYRENLPDRIFRFIKHHRTGFISTTAVLITAFIALLIFNGEIQSKNAELQSSNENLQAVSEESDKRRGRAEQNLRIAQQLALDQLRMAETELSSPGIGTRNPEEVFDALFELRKELSEKTLESFRAIHEQNPDDLDLLAKLAGTLRISGNLRRFEHDLLTAQQRLEESLELWQQIADRSEQIDVRAYIAQTHLDLGIVRKAAGDLLQSDRDLSKALALIQQLEPENPPRFQLNRAAILLEEAALDEEMGRYSIALRTINDAVLISEKVIQNDETQLFGQYIALFASARRIRLLANNKDLNELTVYSGAAINAGRMILEEHPSDPNVIAPLARMLAWSSEGLAGTPDKNSSALKRAEEAVDFFRVLAQRSPKAYKVELASSLVILARLQVLNDRSKEALGLLTEADRMIETIVQQAPLPDHLSIQAEIKLWKAEIQLTDDQPIEASRNLDMAKRIQSEACRLSPASVTKEKQLGEIDRRLESLAVP